MALFCWSCLGPWWPQGHSHWDRCIPELVMVVYGLVVIDVDVFEFSVADFVQRVAVSDDSH
eukprot:2678754-Karenia_brevis.AAC.1